MGFSKSSSSSTAIDLGGQAQADNQSTASSAQQSGYVNTSIITTSDEGTVEKSFLFAGDLIDYQREKDEKLFDLFGQVLTDQTKTIASQIASSNANTEQITGSFSQALTGVDSKAQNQLKIYYIIAGLAVIYFITKKV